MRAFKSLSACCVVVFLAACGSSESPDPDTGQDVGTDSSQDTTQDTTPDVEQDVDEDTTDTTADVEPDVSRDVVNDPFPDTPDTSFDTATDTGQTAPVLCAQTDGEWLENTCGDWVCGAAPFCEAIIPGCDCGLGRTYVEGQGCAVDPDCETVSDQALCETSDGTWDVNACGHYYCGQGNLCNAIIPGCDCGPDENFVEGVGCERDIECLPDDFGERLCVNTAGQWREDSSCAPTVCGVEPPIDCLVPEPNCACGVERTWDADGGCELNLECFDEGDSLCTSTGGDWADGCVHANCGVANTSALCSDNFGACNCGPGLNFDSFTGCEFDATCEATEADACELSGGTWDETTCGHYSCGIPQECGSIIPGCDCGADGGYVDDVGCVDLLQCGACPDRRDPGVGYISDDPEVCAVVDFGCDEGYTAFDSDCGCGCVEN